MAALFWRPPVPLVLGVPLPVAGDTEGLLAHTAPGAQSCPLASAGSRRRTT